jgi:hypothetical protein
MCLSELLPFISESSSLRLESHAFPGQRAQPPVLFAKMADDLVLRNDVEAGKVVAAQFSRKSPALARSRTASGERVAR